MYFSELNDNNISLVIKGMFGPNSEIKGGLSLQRNQIGSLATEVFSNVQMSRIYLNGNQLKDFPSAQLASQTGLKQL